MAYKCDECGKEFTHQKGLYGHLYGVHGRRVGLKADIAEAKNKAEKAYALSRVHTDRLSDFTGEYEGRLEKLEKLLSSKYENRLKKLESLLSGFRQCDDPKLFVHYTVIAKRKQLRIERHSHKLKVH